MNNPSTASEGASATPSSPNSYVPNGYHTLIPYFMVKGAASALDFYKQVLGATEVMRLPGPNGVIMHAEITINGSSLMLADEQPGAEFKSPLSIGGTPVALVVYVPDVDDCVARAASRGARLLRAVQNQFYGDRAGTIVDPFGHIWTIATHIEDVSPEEMQRRMAQMKPCGATP